MFTPISVVACRQGRWRGPATVLVLLHVCLAPLVLSAQTTAPIPVIPADFSPTHTFNWRNIRSVQACHSAVRFVRDSVKQYWRDDTLYADAEQPTPVIVVNVARQCLDRFPIATIDTLELPTVMEIAVLTGDTVPVRAAVDRLLALRKGVQERAEILANVLGLAGYRLHPVSIAFMQSSLARLDSLGPEARLEQAHGRLNIAISHRRRGTTPDVMLTLMQSALTAFQQVSVAALEPQIVTTVVNGIENLKQDIIWYTYLRDGTPGRFQEWVDLHNKPNTPGIVGRLAPAIDGEFWIGQPESNGDAPPGRPGSKPASGRVPVPGSITLVTGFNATGDRQVQEWDLLRRIHQRFPSIKIVLLAQTAGAVWGKIRADDPAAEAALLGQFYLDSLKLPVWINVSKSLIDTTRRDSNGVPAIFASRTFEAWNYGGDINSFYVVNSQGYVVTEFRDKTQKIEMFSVLERLLRFSEPSSAKRE